MSFADILADVYTLTNYPNRANESKLGIRVATIKLHSIDNWREDLVEEQIVVTVDPSTSSFSINLVDELTNAVRKIKYIKKIDSDVFFDEISPAKILDDYNYRKVNAYYRAGNLLHFYTDTSDTAIIIGYYKQPVPTESGYSSWIGDTYPSMIATEAAVFVLSLMGDKEAEQRLAAAANANIAILNMNHLDET